MKIPLESINPSLLTSIVEEFVTREGTDYGPDADISLDRKVESVKKQLKAGTAIVVFDESSETCTIVPASSFSG